jgi:hypothetical protein
MLGRQLASAIGKVVQASDFSEYMDFHNKKLFTREAEPKPFSFAVRQPARNPEGTVSIETSSLDRSGPVGAAPIMTTSVATRATAPMRFALDAATTISFLGERHVHAAVLHQFSSGEHTISFGLDLRARARQFSSFILLVGKVSASDLFEPTAAIVVKDKDDLRTPLLLETIPTPKAFKKAISSISPEQQRFAKAYRGLQLSSTLFGLCVIQIKPQLEKVLGLPPCSLTKEIQVTGGFTNR